ncbi:SDR family NAD(P)-dependent oxidoreductase [Salinicola sp. DM10]|uniref:SDR family NAD(P)-dependent oxidoreductase n=1 Tax=Salinicola sp. DM10 TaxID=2815721 RepID=UPI001A8DCC04|nr:SDR family NAD(P)-dependent oxidoreductase [Salinicola sp. DM10]MCE3028623.1 SDR family NAD(P)-dependent oxidoreductase [Salinicola sp. DM10]
MLERLPDDFTAVVTGASGGIGQAVVRCLLETSRVGRIVAVSRQALAFGDDRVETLEADLTQEAGLARLGERLAGAPLHLLFNTLGMLHDSARDIAPEKRLEELDADTLATLFHVNAITPALLLKAVLGSLKGQHPTLVASLSARVGSIEDNGFGGWYGYRASKAAHNMLLRTAAIELARYNKRAIVLCLHPGTTDTALSQPFQRRVPEGKLFSPEYVAERLLTVISERRPEESGTFWDWAGKPVPW